MGLVIAVYTKEAFKEYVMPAINNADYSITLNKQYFRLRYDFKLEFEVIGDVWRLKPSDAADILLGEKPVRESRILEGDQVYQVHTRGGQSIAVMVRACKSVFSAYEKYDIRRLRRITIGDGEDNLICCSSREQRLISHDHAEITRSGNGCVITSRGQNGLYVNSKFVSGTEELRFGDYINIYSVHLVYLGDILALDLSDGNVHVNDRYLIPCREPEQTKEDAKAAPQEEPAPAKILFHRSPRITEKIEDGEIEIEEPPKETKQEKHSLLTTIGPSFTMAIPMMLGALLMIASARSTGSSTGVFMYSGLVMSVSSSLVGVIWAVVNMREQKKKETEDELKRYEAYSAYLLKKTEEIREKYTHNQKTMNAIYPDAELCLNYDETSAELWNRNAGHEDFLCCRLGLGDVPFQMHVQVPKERFRLERDELAEKPAFIEDNYKTLTGVPILLNLLEHRLVGITGGKEKKGAIRAARIIAAQLAACCCYTEVKLIFIYDEENSENYRQWDFARWLPHVWSEDKKIRYVAGNKREAGEVFYELTGTLRRRLEGGEEQEGEAEKKKFPRPYFVMFLSDPSLIEEELISRYVFDAPPETGLTTIMLAESNEELPNACEYIVENDEVYQGMYNVSAQKEERTAVRFDKVSRRRLERFARRLSNIEVQETDNGGEIPGSLTFFDMYGIQKLSELRVEERWLKNRNYDNIRGLLGQKAGGVPCYLDVHEKYHGPHGLVAGTTGSGKSETLQTYMLSLAINYSPDDIGFFIIDYKGGGMAHLFDGLPHMVGQISNLSGNQVYRAMVSIMSENRRRQRLFTENGVNNINSYTKLYKNGEVSVPIPHLFIIIDEFAELKREQPEFMAKLISVAQVGRSLGVHLILATQKPGGTVDDNIRSNSKFKLCLRVQDRQDSMDMLHKPDAAYITQAGRCYLQVGNDEVYELFQSGYSGAPYDASGESRAELARLLTVNGRTELSGSHVRAQKAAAAAQKKEKDKKTQLDAVKEYLKETAKENGYRQSHPLWMPELSDHIYMGDLAAYAAAAFSEGAWKEPEGSWALKIPVGMMDDPENQAQFPLTVSFSEGGHHAVIGSVVSGKSTLLQTILYGLVTKYSPRYVNVYALDFSSKMLSAFEGLAHFGGILYEEDDDKIAKFFNMIERILKERKKLFHGGNYSQYVQVHGVECPAIIVSIDNFSAFNEKTENRYEQLILQLSKEGVSHGIFLLLSAGGFGMNEIPNRIGENLKTVLCLEMPDKFGYSDVLHVTHIDAVPAAGVKGRGLAASDGRLLEYQAALALAADNDYQRMERIAEICREMNRAWTGKRAQPVPEIPEKPTWEIFSELEDVQRAVRQDNLLPVAYNSENAEVYSVDLSAVYCYLIAGAPHTGKKNYMKIMAEAAALKGAQICMIDGSAQLPQYRGREDLVYVSDAEELFTYFTETLTPVFKERNGIKSRILAEGGEAEELYAYTRKETPVFVFIPDLVWFLKTVYAAENAAKNLRGFTETLMAKGSFHNIFFVGSMDPAGKTEVLGYQAYKTFIGYKTGIHFGGNVSADSFMDFSYLPFKEQSKTEKPGIGQVPEMEGEVFARRVIVPLMGKRKKQ